MLSKFKDYIYEDVKRGTFGSMLAESKKESMAKCSKKIIELFLFADKVHIWHLTCDTDKEHITLNDIYEKTREYADKLAEVLLGEGESIALYNKEVDFKPYSSTSYKEIKDFVDDLNDIANNPLDYTVSISDITKKYITDITSILGVATFE